MTHKMTLSIDQYGNFAFKKGGATPVHKNGHIFLLSEPAPVDLQIALDGPTVALGYAFAPGPGGNPSSGVNALFIAPNCANKHAFGSHGGQFQNPTLSSSSGGAYDTLTFTSANNDGAVYTYQLNFAPTAGLLPYIDPILVNRP